MLPAASSLFPAFTGAQLTAFAISGSFFAIYLYCSIYLQSVLGLSAIEAGLVFVPSTLVMVVVSGATAQLNRSVHPGVLISGGLVQARMAMLTVAQVDSSGPCCSRVSRGADRHRSVQPVSRRRRAGAPSGRAERPAAGVNDTLWPGRDRVVAASAR